MAAAAANEEPGGGGAGGSMAGPAACEDAGGGGIAEAGPGCGVGKDGKSVEEVLISAFRMKHELQWLYNLISHCQIPNEVKC